MNRLIVTLLSSILLLSSTAYAHKNNAMQYANTNVGKDLIAWNQQQKITLLPHQLKPIDYMEKHPEQHGLLLFHEVGTGKTYLGIAFAERNPNKQILILVPRFLKGHWRKNMRNFGVKDPSRYTILSHEEATKLTEEAITNKIVIIDETHRVIKKLDSHDSLESDRYSKLYLNLRYASRILSLTATPIFTDVKNLARQVNLVSGDNTIPFNDAQFKHQYTKIKQHKSALVGHFAESKLVPLTLSYTGALTTATFWPAGSLLGGLGGYFLPEGIKKISPVTKSPLREFDAKEVGGITRQYMSFYDVDTQNKAYYPSKSVDYENVSYNDYQLNFLMRLANSQLSTDELIQIQKEDNLQYDRNYVELNSTQLQDNMKKRFEIGLMIGNLAHKDDSKNNKTIYPKKFSKILNKMLTTKGSVILYSHFYHNGILLFKQFLDEKGYQNQYAILDPDLSSEAFESIVERYNQGKIKFLLLHPEITEGASFLGTQQMHILEPPYNKSLQEQIIGRVIRYRSHMHLPKNERHVSVYIWKSTFDIIDLPHGKALREDWQRNFSELNYYGQRTLVDANNHMKQVSPDEIAYQRKHELDKSTEDLINLLKEQSIETKSNQAPNKGNKSYSLQERIDPFEMPSTGVSYMQYPSITIFDATGGQVRDKTRDKAKSVSNKIITLHLTKPFYGKYFHYGYDFSINYSWVFVSTDTMLSLHAKFPVHLGNFGDLAIGASSGIGISTALGGKAGSLDKYDSEKYFYLRLGSVMAVNYGIEYFPVKWLGITCGLQNRYYHYAKSFLGNKKEEDPTSSNFRKGFNFNVKNRFYLGIKTTI